MAANRRTLLTIMVGASVVNIILLFAYFHQTELGFLIQRQQTSNRNQRKLMIMAAEGQTKMAAAPVTESSKTTRHPSLLEILFGGSGNGTRKKEALKGPRLNRLLNVTATEYIINKMDVCKDGGVSIMATVVSAANHRQARDAIRETWGNRTRLGPNMRMIFFVGLQKHNQAAILAEDELNGDIVQADFVDSYQNLTFKSVLLLRWVIEHCPKASYLLKVDDDMFVNVANLVNLTARLGNVSRTIIGKSAVNWHPIRDKKSPYYVSKSSWNSIIYPKFVTGPSYLVTGDSLPHLYKHATRLPYLFLEDVFVTGMAAEKARIARVNHGGFHNTKTVINPCVLRRVVSSHWLSPSRLRAAWKVLHSYASNFTDCWYPKCSSYVLGICISTTPAPIDFYPRISPEPIKKA